MSNVKKWQGNRAAMALVIALVVGLAPAAAIRATNTRPDHEGGDRGDDRDPHERTPIRHVVVIFQVTANTQ